MAGWEGEDFGLCAVEANAEWRAEFLEVAEEGEEVIVGEAGEGVVDE